MRKVVDAGYLRSEKTYDYLSRSKKNYVVLTDYACMESLKGRSTTNFEKQIHHISKFPDQVLVLKGTRKICRTSTRPSGLQKRLIDYSQTKAFRAFCRRYKNGGLSQAADTGDLLNRSDEATSYIDSLVGEHRSVQGMFLEQKEALGPEILKSLRSGRGLSADQRERVIKAILLVAGFMMQKHPDSEFIYDFSLAKHHFLFREAISSYALTLDWLSRGGLEAVSNEEVRNDVVDSTYVAYSTFFDGLLTNDTRMKRTHTTTQAFMRELGM